MMAVNNKFHFRCHHNEWTYFLLSVQYEKYCMLTSRSASYGSFTLHETGQELGLGTIIFCCASPGPVQCVWASTNTGVFHYMAKSSVCYVYSGTSFIRSLISYEDFWLQKVCGKCNRHFAKYLAVKRRRPLKLIGIRQFYNQSTSQCLRSLRAAVILIHLIFFNMWICFSVFP